MPRADRPLSSASTGRSASARPGVIEWTLELTGAAHKSSHEERICGFPCGLVIACQAFVLVGHGTQKSTPKMGVAPSAVVVTVVAVKGWDLLLFGAKHLF